MKFSTNCSIASKITLLLLATSTHLFADAGSIQRDIEQKLDKQKSTFDKQKSTSLQQDNEAKILVKNFVFSGNTVVPSDELQTVVSKYNNQELSFKQLQSIVANVSEYYAQAGGLAKVYLPKQDITNGTVAITVVEGKLNSVIIDNKEAVLSKDEAEKYIYANNTKGEPIKNKDMSASLANLNSMGGMSAKSSIAPGQKEGSSDIVIKLKDAQRYQGDIGVDNYGSKSTGVKELTAGIIVNNLSKSNMYDNLNIRAMGTQGVKYARVGYMLPIGYNGDKIGASFSAMNYELIEKYASSDGDGSSHTKSLHYEHPIIKTKQQNLSFSLELANKYGKNSINNATTSIKRTNVANMILAYDKADNILSGGSTKINLGVSVGKLNLKDDTNNYTSDQQNANTHGMYAKYKLNITREQAITDELSLQVSYQYQTANKNLDSAEELSLGGAYGVRAYPTNEASGDSGWLSNIELKYALTTELTPSIFYDYGKVKTNINQWAGDDNTEYTLSGYGIGLNFATNENMNIKGQVSRVANKSYDPNNNGLNSDGSPISDTRYWLSSTWFF